MNLPKIGLEDLKNRAADLWRRGRGLLFSFLFAFFALSSLGILFLEPDLAGAPAGGTAMRQLARILAIAFGAASIPVCLLIAVHAVLQLLGRGIELHARRILAGCAVLILLPTLFAMMERASGGVLGVLTRDAVQVLFPDLFAFPLLVGCVLFSLVLSTDWLFYGAVQAPRMAGDGGTLVLPKPEAKRKSKSKPRPQKPKREKKSKEKAEKKAKKAPAVVTPVAPVRPEPETVVPEGFELDAGEEPEPEPAEEEEPLTVVAALAKHAAAAEGDLQDEEDGEDEDLEAEEDEEEEGEEEEEEEEEDGEDEDWEEEDEEEWDEEEEDEDWDEEDDEEEEEEDEDEDWEDDEDEGEEEEGEEPKAGRQKRTVAATDVAPKPPPPPVAAPPARSRPRRTEARPFDLPALDLLERAKPIDLGRVERAIQRNAQILERALASFKIEARVVGYERGPVITMYELSLKEGTKLSRINNLSDDMAIALKAESVRIVAPIPGRSTVGVEVPNAIRDEVRLRDLADEADTDKAGIPIFLGRNAAGSPVVEDLAQMPHLLIAGATGAGKSVCINSIILSILMTRRPEQIKLILIDPKQVELAFFREIPHLLTGVVTEARKAAQALEWVVNEMEDRYWIFSRFGVRNITAYNKLGAKKVRQLAKEHDIAEEKAPVQLPFLVVVVDELADLIMTGKKEVEQAVTRLAQKSRAVGIHTVLATQRPSTDVITGLIKANMPCRAAFKVTSKVDSRVVLDQNGAEKLLGRGDMLFLPPRSFHLARCQGTFISDDEVKQVVKYLKENAPPPELKDLFVRPATLEEQDPREVDDLFISAARIVIDSQRGSASLLQRALSIGYTRASRLIDLMRNHGIIGEFKNAQAAEVLMDMPDFTEKFGEA